MMDGDTRAAFVWFPSSPGAGVPVSQDLGIPSEIAFLKYLIEVNRAPPVFPPGEGTREAELVFYVDGDGNRELDVREYGTNSPDLVVGRAPGTRIVWGYTPTTDTPATDPKRNLAPRVCKKEAPDFALSCDTKETQGTPGSAPSTSIRILFVNEDVLSGYTCSRFWGSQEWADTSPRFSEKLRAQIRSGCKSETSEVASTEDSACQCLPMEGGGWRACVRDPELCGTKFCYVAEQSAGGALGCP
jgi:hypothetical protein